MLSIEKIIVTGGSGFIGSNLIKKLLSFEHCSVLNIDKLTYAACPNTLQDIADEPRYHFLEADIANRELIEKQIHDFKPDAIVNVAAESHVDRSIHDPLSFMQSNVLGTYQLLEVARSYWEALEDQAQGSFVFYQVSTDEAFGDIELAAPPCDESTTYNPSSPYSASKASADHLVNAWYKTYNLPVKISRCTNNYGPYQFPEKFIPLMINNAVAGKILPVYGDGSQIRDWLHVSDHVNAILEILANGKVGESYNIAGNNQFTNLEVLEVICALLDKHKPGNKPYKNLIRFVEDRPGHDRRYALNDMKLRQELGWRPNYDLTSGLEATVKWNLDNQAWVNAAMEKNSGV